MTNKKETASAELFDIGALDTVAASDKGAEIELLHPTEHTPLGVFISILGKHSTTFREIVQERANNRVRKESFAARRGKPTEPRTAQQVEAEAIDLIVACTTNWFTVTRNEKGEVINRVDVMRFRGEDLPFNHANAKRVITEMLWVREQVDNAIGDLENFIKA